MADYRDALRAAHQRIQALERELARLRPFEKLAEDRTTELEEARRRIADLEALLGDTHPVSK